MWVPSRHPRQVGVLGGLTRGGGFVSAGRLGRRVDDDDDGKCCRRWEEVKWNFARDVRQRRWTTIGFDWPSSGALKFHLRQSSPMTLIMMIGFSADRIGIRGFYVGFVDLCVYDTTMKFRWICFVYSKVFRVVINWKYILNWYNHINYQWLINFFHIKY